MTQLSNNPHLIYPITMIVLTNLVFIAFAVFATRPELVHGKSDARHLMFYGNFKDMEEDEYVNSVIPT